MINGDAGVKNGIFFPGGEKIWRSNMIREKRKKDPYNISEERGLIILEWKRISHKRTKNKAKNDKTEHGMERCEKTKPNRSQKVNQAKKSKSKSTPTKSSQLREAGSEKNIT
ncbi:hypothetical protein Tco_0189324 [Tanacetum coccineum]